DDCSSAATVADGQFIDDSAEAEAEKPGNDDVIAIDMTDQIEVLQESPDSSHAESKSARPKGLPDHQHADIFILLFHQVATDRGEDSNNRQGGEDGDGVSQGVRHQPVLETVYGRKEERDVGQA